MRYSLAILALVAFTVTGCDAVSNRLPTFMGGSDETNAGIRTLSLMDGSLRARGPDGYCIDQRASNARRGFVLMAGCARMSEEAAIMPSLDGVITVQFGAPESASVSGNVAEFASLLESAPGQTLLASGDDAAQLSRLTIQTGENHVIAGYNDASDTSLPGVSGPLQRGFVDIADRLVTVTVRSFDNAPLSARDSTRLIEAAIKEIVTVNAPQTATSDQN